MKEDSIPRKTIIFKEAAKLFREKGYQAANLRELARRAGIQGGSIYHHFSSKQEILFQLMNNTMNDMIERLLAILAPLESPTEQLRQTMRFHIEYHIVGTDETYITDDELRNLEPDNYLQIIAKRDRYQHLIEGILRQGQQLENWQISDIKLFSRAVIQMCAGVTRWYQPKGNFTIDEIAAQYFSLVTRGLLPG